MFRVQDGYRRQYAECVGRQEDNLVGCRTFGYRFHDVLDVVYRIGNAGVFRHALVGEVDFAVGVHSHVLQQGVAFDGVVDVRFAVLVQVDDLGIAAAFVVEYAFIVPAVFVVTDEETFRVGGKGGLAGSGQAEEDGGILTVQVGIGGTVH